MKLTRDFSAREVLNGRQRFVEGAHTPGETVVGVSAPIDSTRSQLEDILSKNSYSFLTLDSQHSPYNGEKLVSLRSGAHQIRKKYVDMGVTVFMERPIA